MVGRPVANRDYATPERLDLTAMFDDASNLLATEQSAEMPKEDDDCLLPVDDRVE